MADRKVEIIITARDSASKTLTGLGNIAGGIFKTGLVAGLGAVTALGVGVGALLKTTVPLASDLSETFNKVNVIFGESSDAIIKFSETADIALGQTKQQALDAASTFGVFGKAAKLTGPELTDFSLNLTGLASDLASFYNASPEETITALGAALRGESEPIRRFGVLLDDATLRQKAFELGITDTTKKALTPQQRVLAAYNVILDQTTDAQGDFARTSDGLANSQRIAAAQWVNLKTSIGTFFLPAAQKAMKFISATALPVLNDFVGFLGTIVNKSGDSSEALGKLPPALQPIAQFIGGLVLSFQTFFTVLAAGNNPLLALAGLITNLGLTLGLSNQEALKISQTFLQVATTIQTFIMGTLVPFVQQHLPEFKGALLGIGAVLAIAGIITTITAVIGTLLSPIGLVIAGAALLGAAWAGNWGDIQGKTAAVIGFLRPLIQGFISGIQTWWAQNGAKIIAIAKGIWDGIVAGFNFFKNLFKGAFTAWKMGLEGDWRGMGEALRKQWDELWGKIKTIVNTAIDNVKTKFKTTDWGSVGRNIIEGIAKGISAALSVIKNAAIAAARAALEAAKGFLGIDSPSRVFQGVGANLMQGMAKGISNNSILPARAMTAASARTTSSAMQTTNNRISSTVSVGQIVLQLQNGMNAEAVNALISDALNRQAVSRTAVFANS